MSGRGVKPKLANGKPPRRRSQELANEILQTLGDLSISNIYRLKIRPLRTRCYQLKASKKAAIVEILYTLLGIELKIGKRRILCPDLATARFLRVFAHIGIEDVAMPYDITQTSHLADQLESSWNRMLMLVELATQEMSLRMKTRVRSLLIAQQRHEIIQLGAGPAIPQFNQNTKQRRLR